MADGRAIQSIKGSKKFKWIMPGTLFQDDFLVLPIGNCYVVLGIQWLCKLGDIYMNFGKLFMQIVYQGQYITLQGTYPSFKTVEAKAFNKIPVDIAQIFMIKVSDVGVSDQGSIQGEKVQGNYNYYWRSIKDC